MSVNALTADAPTDDTGIPRVSTWTRLATNNTVWIFIILVAICAAFASLQPNFLKPFNVRSIFSDASYLGVLAIGMTFVIITAGIDLSVGSVLIFSGVIAGKTILAIGSSGSELALNAGWGAITLGLLAGIGAGLGWGVVNGFLIAKAKIPPLIVTLGTLGMALGASYLLTGGTDLRGMPQRLTANIGFGLVAGQIPWQVIIAGVAALLCGLALAYTRFGRYTYAVGSNGEGARRVGIKVDRHLIKVYALMGALAGLAGDMSLAHFTTTTLQGHTTDNLSAIAAVVIGGTSLFGGSGLVAGSIIGVLIPAVLQNGFNILSVNTYWQNVAVGLVLVAAVYLDQLRRRTRQRT